MKPTTRHYLIFSFYLLLCSLIQYTQAYLNEPHAPFSILSPPEGTTIKQGEHVNITWQLTAGTEFPIYGYAAASTSQTIIGLLPPESRRDERYVHKIDSNVKLTDLSYIWTVDEQIPPGAYRIGIGFYYHETSPLIHIV
ncbi:uncharacterized protein BX664DRAFT_329777 [Halteromyces radiatus]|uniref:uncharacterized protein n=1 Tax=Halteromyces radiatus TaxID=101107 RepID=UPI002220BC5D|nr:uncharacterized protein BX664DRAFT_329777 [Halteromyces radiatus]KAI8093466.1 hypothetical protein BX664DRAFT_329777 [Halteromyces radiatus]